MKNLMRHKGEHTMNKLIKLPIFLGVCGAACAGILAGVNAVTAPIIEKAKAEKANAAYIELYKDFNVTGTDVVTEDVDNDDLLKAGCSVKAIIINDYVKGVTYTCSVTGYGGKIEFQVAFANGKYLGYTDLGNSETNGYGKSVIEQMNGLIKDLDGSQNLMSNSDYTSAISGKSITGKALANSIEVCRVDYMAWYSAQ